MELRKSCDLSKDFPPNTLGYHYKFSRVVFGEDSPATEFLQKKADESPSGFDEKVIAPEEQVVHLLGSLHFNGK